MATMGNNERYTVAPLSVNEERELGWAILNDNCHQSREKMILANLHLVSSVACRYAGRGVPLGELVERGKVGLVRAVEHYDPAQGMRFSTPARWWIKEAIRQAVHAAEKKSDQINAVDVARREREKSPAFGRSAGNEAKPWREGASSTRGASANV